MDEEFELFESPLSQFRRLLPVEYRRDYTPSRLLQ